MTNEEYKTFSIISDVLKERTVVSSARFSNSNGTDIIMFQRNIQPHAKLVICKTCPV